MNKLHINILGLVMMLLVGHSYAGTQHLVEPNETLSGIASRYGITETQLISANGLNKTFIKAGDVLAIPDPDPSLRYKIQSGDSLTKVSQKLGVDINQLASANDLSPQADIMTGNYLVIPSSDKSQNQSYAAASTVPASKSLYSVTRINANNNTNNNAANINTNNTNQLGANQYRVKYGETLTILSQKFGVPVNKLAQFNNMKIDDVLPFGDLITIPTASQLRSMGNSPANTTNTNNTASQPIDYTVKRGDTLFDLAGKYDLDVRYLAKYNNIDYYEKLIIGQKLKIPPKPNNAESQ